MQTEDASLVNPSAKEMTYTIDKTNSSTSSINNPSINTKSTLDKLQPPAQSTASSASSEDCQEVSIKSVVNHNPNESIRNWLLRISKMQTENNHKVLNEQFSATKKCASVNVNSGRVVKYQDLPYMGEITLDNTKPRRGRKPKKADICHLIYKNYGTIFPGTPGAKGLQESAGKQDRSDVQNRIISSLLEKRLMQESKRQQENVLSLQIQIQEEPLNLCVRDLDQLRIRLLKKDDLLVDHQSVVKIKQEPQSDDEVEFVPLQTNKSSGSEKPSTITPTDDFVYWSNSGLFIHPLTIQKQLLYYQKLTTNQPVPTAPIIDLPKLKPKVRSIKTKHASNQRTNFDTEHAPVKRKRSAIFIPPIPAENLTNPATEVSICKFKFTGGAKPTLQEKKMLSVDAGGNFRYYSGTGDKSMRGYEFFPREALQQQVGNGHGSSTGAFLQASGEKMYPVNGSTENMTATAGKAVINDFMLTPDLPSNSAIHPSFDPMDLNLTFKHQTANNKRKSRKSLQREKLEQTFKEKGFLIQTQQLESAEGATYCKFRQLRKFTRYLFRSWKDYLPNGGATKEKSDMLEDGDIIDSLSKMSKSSTASSSDVLTPT